MSQDRRQQRFTAAAVLALVLFGVVTVILDWSQLRQVLGSANWWLVAPAVFSTAVSYAFLSYSFAAICRIFDIRLGRRDLFEIGFVSWALNHLVAAGGAAGYSLRILLIKRRGLPARDVLAASLFHSTLNNLMLFVLLPIGLIFGIAAHPLAPATTAWAVAGALLVLLLTVFVAAAAFVGSIRAVVLSRLDWAWHRLTGRDISVQLGDLDATLGRGIGAIWARPRLLAGPLVLVVGDWAASVTALWFCFAALGSPINVGVLLAGFAVGVVAGMLSMVPGGLGVQEGSMAAVYALLGVPLGQAALAAILFRLVYYIMPFLLSLGFYRRLLRAKEIPQGVLGEESNEKDVW